MRLSTDFYLRYNSTYPDTKVIYAVMMQHFKCLWACSQERVKLQVCNLSMETKKSSFCEQKLGTKYKPWSDWTLCSCVAPQQYFGHFLWSHSTVRTDSHLILLFTVENNYFIRCVVWGIIKNKTKKKKFCLNCVFLCRMFLYSCAHYMEGS